MSIFVKPTPAPVPKTKDVTRIATFYALILVVMAVAQLFTFDEFVKLVATFNLPGGETMAHGLTALLVIAEVFALPFLLRMQLSPAFRVISMVFGWLVPLIWLTLTIWLVIKDGISDSVGFLGTAVTTMPGWWAVSISIALGILAAWAAWGMWPIPLRMKRVKKTKK